MLPCYADAGPARHVRPHAVLTRARRLAARRRRVPSFTRAARQVGAPLPRSVQVALDAVRRPPLAPRPHSLQVKHVRAPNGVRPVAGTRSRSRATPRSTTGGRRGVHIRKVPVHWQARRRAARAVRAREAQGAPLTPAAATRAGEAQPARADDAGGDGRRHQRVDRRAQPRHANGADRASHSRPAPHRSLAAAAPPRPHRDPPAPAGDARQRGKEEEGEEVQEGRLRGRRERRHARPAAPRD